MPKLTKGVLKSHPLPEIDGDTDKNSRGRVLVVAGSQDVPGAALLSANAVLRAGAGKVQIGAPKSIAVALAVALPEAGLVCLAEDRKGEPVPKISKELKAAVQEADAVIIGPGHTDETSATLFALRLLALKSKAVFIVDAAATSGLWKARARVRKLKRPIVITPHYGEAATMLDIRATAVAARPKHYAKELALGLDCTVILKGATTQIVAKGKTWVHDAGVVGLATSGSGDVLAGLIAGLVARGTDVLSSALWAVSQHAAAGRLLARKIGKVGFLASEILPLLPRLVQSI